MRHKASLNSKLRLYNDEYYTPLAIKILNKFMISLHERRNTPQSKIYSAQSNII